MKFLVILTMFAAPVDVASNAPLTLEPIGTIEFRNTTEKNTTADCVRVEKALRTSKIQAFCAPVQPLNVASAE